MPAISLNIPSKGEIPTNTFGSITQQSIGGLNFSKVWGVTPNFSKLRESHNLPMNAYTISRKESWRGQGFYSVFTKPSGPTRTISGIPAGEFDADTGTSTTPSSTVLSKVKAKAEAKLLTKLKNQQVNLAQAFAERKRTAQLIESSIQRIIAAFRALRRKQLDEALAALGAGPPSRRRRKRINAVWYGKRGRETAVHSKDEFKNAAGVWLELQYGWRPLLNDIYESAKEIIAATDHSPRKVRTAAGASSYDFSTDKVVLNTTQRVYRIQKKVTSVQGRCVVWYSTPDVPRTLSQLGFTNPAYLAWELTPFSFVVDWFLPIGNALNAFDATLGLSFDKGCYSVKVNSSVRSTAVGRETEFHNTVGGCTTFRSEQTYDRSRYIEFPSVVFPDFKNPISPEHALNAIALLIQVFSGKA